MVARLQGHDLDDVEWLHKNYKLEKDKLIEIYKSEFRSIYVGDQSRLDLNFNDLLEALFDN